MAQIVFDHPQTYYDRMDSALGDKKKIIDKLNEYYPNIEERKNIRVLDAGCGSGLLSMEIAKQGYSVLGIDADIDCSSYSYVETIDGNTQKVNFFQLDIKDMLKLVDTFDVVIFCSVLHELYSYNDYDKRAVCKAIDDAREILKPNGLLIIRDGITDEEYIDIFRPDLHMTPEFRHLYDMYGEYSNVPQQDRTLQERLYTCSWGRQSFNREKDEVVHFLTEFSWISIVGVSGFHNLSFDSYFQESYRKHIENLFWFDDNKYPLTNHLAVYQKVQYYD